MYALFVASVRGLLRRLISSWAQLVHEQVAVKYAKPCRTEEGMAVDEPDFEYRRVVKYNYSTTDLSVLAGTISMIKALVSCCLNHSKKSH